MDSFIVNMLVKISLVERKGVKRHQKEMNEKANSIITISSLKIISLSIIQHTFFINY
jgi:hypothetical protein